MRSMAAPVPMLTPLPIRTPIRTPMSVQAALFLTCTATIVLGVLPGLIGRYGDLTDLTGAFGG